MFQANAERPKFESVLWRMEVSVNVNFRVAYSAQPITYELSPQHKKEI